MLSSDCRLKDLWRNCGGESVSAERWWVYCIMIAVYRAKLAFWERTSEKKKNSKKPSTVPSNLSQKQLVIFSSAHTQPVSQGRSVFFTAVFGVKSPVLSLSQTVEISVWICIITFLLAQKSPRDIDNSLRMGGKKILEGTGAQLM